MAAPDAALRSRLLELGYLSAAGSASAGPERLDRGADDALDDRTEVPGQQVLREALDVLDPARRRLGLARHANLHRAADKLRSIGQQPNAERRQYKSNQALP